MMRPLMTLVLAATLLGGLQWFMVSRNRQAGRQVGAQLIRADGEFSVELTFTFDAGQDEFNIVAPEDAPSVLVMLQGKELVRCIDDVAGDSPLVIKPVDGVVIGNNEFYLQASPADSDSLIPRAVRIRVLRDDNPLAESTLWSNSGAIVQGTITVHVPP